MEISDSLEYIKACTSHHFKFNNTQIMNLKTGQFISSPVFQALGHDWVIDCYCQAEYKKFWPSFLIRLRGEYKDMNPTFGCSLGRRDGTSTSLSRCLKGKGGNFWLVIGKSPFQGQVFACLNLEYSLQDFKAHDGSYELICSIDNTDINPNKFSPGVPKSFNLQSQIEKLLENSETADVTFVVENNSFRCHGSILAARSPVLKAELYGNMAEATQKQIKIEDISPEVFKALLRFMYTDTFPFCDSETVSAEMAQHLLVAADRYAIEGLKSLCEDKLCDSISLVSVASSLALAEQHNSSAQKFLLGVHC